MQQRHIARFTAHGQDTQLFQGGHVAPVGLAPQEPPQHIGRNSRFLLVEGFAHLLQLRLFPAAEDVLGSFGHRPADLGVRGRLDDIIKTAQAHRLLCIVELGVSREEDTARLHALLTHPGQQLEAVFHGHFDIAQHHIRRPAAQAGPGVHGVVGRIHFGKAYGLPIDALF